MKDVTRGDVQRFVDDVRLGKTAKSERSGKLRGKTVVTGGDGTAARTVGVLGSILTYAVDRGVIEHNPAHGVKKPSDNVRERRLTPSEFRALGDALRGAEADRDHPQAYQMIWVLALTGCRLGEIAQLRWSFVDFDGRCLRLPDSKEGRSIRPLGAEALRLLRQAEQVDGNPYVFTGIRGDNRSSFFGGYRKAEKRIIQDRAGLSDVTAHVLRHSFSSVATDLGFPEATVDDMTGHKRHTMTSRYIHSLPELLLNAADNVSGEIYRQMTDG